MVILNIGKLSWLFSWCLASYSYFLLFTESTKHCNIFLAVFLFLMSPKPLLWKYAVFPVEHPGQSECHSHTTHHYCWEMLLDSLSSENRFTESSKRKNPGFRILGLEPLLPSKTRNHQGRTPESWSSSWRMVNPLMPEGLSLRLGNFPPYPIKTPWLVTLY